jgi:hypothetical protein
MLLLHLLLCDCHVANELLARCVEDQVLRTGAVIAVVGFLRTGLALAVYGAGQRVSRGGPLGLLSMTLRCPLCRFCATGAFDGARCMLDGLPAWTAHSEYQESLSARLLVKHCIEVCCCLYLESRI